jgi:hypothetical protein
VHGEPEAHPSDAPHRPKLDPEAANLDTAGPFATPRERRRRHDRDWAIDRMQPRARVDTATVIVVAVVVLVLVAIALAGYLIQHGRGSTPTTTTTTTLHRTATSVSGGPSRTVGPRSQQAAMAARQIDPNEIVALREGTGLLSSSRSVAVRATTTVHVSTSASASALRAVATGTVAVQVRG